MKKENCIFMNNNVFLIIMNGHNKKQQRIKSVSIYFFIIVFTVIVNIPTYMFATWCIISDFCNYISEHVSFLYIRKPIFLWGGGLVRAIALASMINILLLLIVEFGLIWLFRKRLNKIFRINELFTTKKIIWLAIITFSVQLIISCWLWQIDPQYGEIYPVDDELIIN